MVLAVDCVFYVSFLLKLMKEEHRVFYGEDNVLIFSFTGPEN